MAFIHHRSEGIILKKEERGEANILFTIFSRDFGKVKVLGRSIRKIKSKLRAGTNLFYYSQFEFIQGKTYKTLTDAIAIKKYPEINDNLLKAAIAQKIAFAVYSLSVEEEKDSDIWLLLTKTFEKLANLKIDDKKETFLFYYHFFWQLIKILGYWPELFHCVYCQEKIKEKNVYFSPDGGGIVCQKCRFKLQENSVFPADKNSIKLLRLFGEKDIDSNLKVIIGQQSLSSLKKISDAYLNYLLEEL